MRTLAGLLLFVASACSVARADEPDAGEIGGLSFLPDRDVRPAFHFRTPVRPCGPRHSLRCRSDVRLRVRADATVTAIAVTPAALRRATAIANARLAPIQERLGACCFAAVAHHTWGPARATPFEEARVTLDVTYSAGDDVPNVRRVLVDGAADDDELVSCAESSLRMTDVRPRPVEELRVRVVTTCAFLGVEPDCHCSPPPDVPMSIDNL